MLDSARILERRVAYLSMDGDEQQVKEKSQDNAYIPISNKVGPIGTDDDHIPNGTQKSGTDSSLADWSKLKAPRLEINALLETLRYTYLGTNSTYPVIRNNYLDNVEVKLLLWELRKHMKALGYSLDDITWISPELCTHHIHQEDASKTSIESKRRLNPNLREVVRKRSLNSWQHV